MLVNNYHNIASDSVSLSLIFLIRRFLEPPFINGRIFVFHSPKLQRNFCE